MLIGGGGVGRHSFDPGDVAATILKLEVGRLEGLGDENPLLPEARQEDRLPKAGVKIRGLTVARPVWIWLGQRQVELVQYPRRPLVRAHEEHVEGPSRLTVS